MTTIIQSKTYDSIAERMNEIDNVIFEIRKNAGKAKDKIEYALQKQPLMNVMAKEIELLKPLLDFYSDIDELNY